MFCSRSRYLNPLTGAGHRKVVFFAVFIKISRFYVGGKNEKAFFDFSFFNDFFRCVQQIQKFVSVRRRNMQRSRNLRRFKRQSNLPVRRRLCSERNA